MCLGSVHGCPINCMDCPGNGVACPGVPCPTTFAHFGLGQVYEPYRFLVPWHLLISSLVMQLTNGIYSFQK